VVIIEKILEELSKPDDQGRDWYGWVTNQTGHITIGVFTTAISLQFLTTYYAIVPLLLFAVLKESFDLRGGGKVKDSFVDFTFQILGSTLCVGLFIKNLEIVNLSVGITILSLTFGLIPRVKKAILNDGG
jgi:hypothetical protein